MTPKLARQLIRCMTSKTFFELDIAEAVDHYIRNKRTKIIPHSFVVPNNDKWPSKLAGKPLGHQIARAKSQKQELLLSNDNTMKMVNKLKILWYEDAVESWNEIIIPSLKIYRRLYCRDEGIIDVPASFIIPESKEWPSNTWNVPLGIIVQNIRTKRYYVNGLQAKERQKQLDEIGFSWDSFNSRFHSVILPAICKYKELYGNLLIPYKFVVPQDNLWPKESQGISIGRIVSCIRRGAYSNDEFKNGKENLDCLTNLGFVWKSADMHYKEIVYPSLVAFKKLYGHCQVPSSFIIPETNDFPLLAWGINLGNIYCGIKYNGSYCSIDPVKRKELEALGIKWNPQICDSFEKRWLTPLIEGLKDFQTIYGSQTVARKFRIPLDDSRFSKSSRGFHLGYAVDRARQLYRKNQLTQYCINELELIGFTWKVQESQWEIILKAIKIYKKLHSQGNNTFFIPVSYVIHDTNEWPKELWGMKLGKIAATIRSQSSYIKKNPERQEVLQQLGFSWKKLNEKLEMEETSSVEKISSRIPP